MKIVTYNIHYGVGADDGFDLQRIADTVDGADVRSDVNYDRRIDYIFVSANLAERLGRAHVERDAGGSDHQPLWLEFES